MPREVLLRQTHFVKAWPEHFAAYESGSKPWTLRFNDRDYRHGDELVISEWDTVKEEYTGNRLSRRIVRIWEHAPGLAEGFVIMTLEPMVRKSKGGA